MVDSGRNYENAFGRIDEHQRATDERIKETNARISQQEAKIVNRSEIDLLVSRIEDLTRAVEKRVDVLEEQGRKMFWTLVSLFIVVIGGISVSIALGGLGL